MKRLALFFLYMILIGTGSPWSVAAQSAEELLNAAKLDTFDENWGQALVKLRQLQRRYPDSPISVQASFWQAYCLDKSGEWSDALKQYENFLDLADRDIPQVKQARFSIVRLSCQLYREGNRRYIDRALEAIEASDDDLRLLAAVQISYLSNTRVTRKAVPVLLEFMEESPEPEIQNQAALALLRIDPEILDERSGKGRKESREKGEGGEKSARKFLRMSIVDGGTESFRFSLPLSLARMLFSSLPEAARESLEEEGIHPENLLEELEKANEMLEIKSGDQVFRLWVE